MKRKVMPSNRDIRQLRVRNFLMIASIMTPVVAYFSYCAGGLFKYKNVMQAGIEKAYMYCLTHPLYCQNEKSGTVVLAGLTIWAIFVLMQYIKINNNLMHGKEYGEAKWGSIKEFNNKYEDKNDKNNNKIMSENARFRYSDDTLRNNNMFVVGGSGAGKTAMFLTPNLMQNHGCNIYTDPKGDLVDKMGNYLNSCKDTEVYCINMCEPEKSMHFNPFCYVRNSLDLSLLVSSYMKNTEENAEGYNNGDPFWTKAEAMFLKSIFYYVWLECPMETVRYDTGEAFTLKKDWKSVLYLLEEAQFRMSKNDEGKTILTDPPLDAEVLRMIQ